MLIALWLGVALAQSEPCSTSGPLPACQAACEAKDGVACRNAAGLLVLVGDAAGARSAWARGCEHGDAESCTLLAAAVNPDAAPVVAAPAPAPKPVPVEDLPPPSVLGPAPASEADRSACDKGDGLACYRVAQAVRATPPLYKVRLMQACEYGVKDACSALQQMAKQPLIVPRP